MAASADRAGSGVAAGLSRTKLATQQLARPAILRVQWQGDIMASGRRGVNNDSNGGGASSRLVRNGPPGESSRSGGSSAAAASGGVLVGNTVDPGKTGSLVRSRRIGSSSPVFPSPPAFLLSPVSPSSRAFPPWRPLPVSDRPVSGLANPLIAGRCGPRRYLRFPGHWPIAAAADRWRPTATARR